MDAETIKIDIRFVDGDIGTLWEVVSWELRTDRFLEAIDRKGDIHYINLDEVFEFTINKGSD